MLWLDLVDDGLCIDYVGSLVDTGLDEVPEDDFDPQHEGHGGWTADELAGSIIGWTTAADPDIVLLLAGANDIIQGDGVANAVFDVGLMIDGLRMLNPEVTVLLGRYFTPYTPFPDDPLFAAVLAEFAALDDELLLLAATKTAPSSPVITVDLGAGFDAEFDTFDGVHPNAVGEQKIADAWRAVLSPLLAPTPAGATSYGAGVPGIHGVPVLTSELPVVGATPTLTIGNATGGATTGYLLFGFAPASVPKGWGGELLVTPFGVVDLVFPDGDDLVLPVPVPAEGAFCGLAAYFQVVEFDAGAVAGVAASAGLEWVLGAAR